MQLQRHVVLRAAQARLGTQVRAAIRSVRKVLVVEFVARLSPVLLLRTEPGICSIVALLDNPHCLKALLHPHPHPAPPPQRPIPPRAAGGRAPEREVLPALHRLAGPCVRRLLDGEHKLLLKESTYMPAAGGGILMCSSPRSASASCTRDGSISHPGVCHRQSPEGSSMRSIGGTGLPSSRVQRPLSTPIKCSCEN